MKSSVPPTSASPTFTTVTASDLEVDSGTLSVDETNNRVGVNTTSPTKALSVDGDLHFQPTAITTGHITAAGSLDIRAADNLKIGTDGADSIRIGRDNSTSCKVHIRSGSDADLVVTDGKVGIANETPPTELDVVGSTKITPGNATTAISVDQDFTSTDAATIVMLDLDFSKTGGSTSNNSMYGLRVDMSNTSATSGSNTMVAASLQPTCQHAAGAGTVMVKGLEVIATGGTPGTETARALDLVATGADYNQGIYMQIADGGPDLKMVSSADSGDFCTLSVGAAGATTLVTVDDGGAAADLTMQIDGAFSVAATSSSFNNAVTAAGVVLSEASSLNIAAPSLPTTDHTSTGLTAQMLAGGAIAAFETVCIHTVTGEVVITDADAIGTMPVIGIAPAAISDTATGTILLQGFIRDDSWNWTPGGVLFASGTAGAMTQTAPSGTGDLVQALGVALTADVVYFNPSLTLVEVA